MAQDRRTFLKTTALAGIAAAGVPFTSTAPLAQKAAVGPQTMPRGFVFATLRRADGYGLRVGAHRGGGAGGGGAEGGEGGGPAPNKHRVDGQGGVARPGPPGGEGQE